MRNLYLVIFCFLFFCKQSLGQSANTKLINVSYQQAGIEQVVSDLESKTGYHFYYDPKAFDSLRVTLQVNQQPVDRILDQAFNNTNFHYAITDQQEILLTKGRAVQTKLANGFFGQKPKAAGQVQQQAQAFTTDEKEKNVAEATIENKTYEIGFTWRIMPKRWPSC